MTYSTDFAAPGAPAIPPPPAAPAIAYHDDAEGLRPWVRFVRAVAAVGLVVAAASLGQVVVRILPVLGFSFYPTGSPLVATLLMAVVPVLLLLGSIGCLTLRPYGRRFMIAYAIAHGVLALVQIGYTVYIASNGGLGLASRSREALGYVFYFSLSGIQQFALPAVVLILMLQPTVKRAFRRG